MKSKFLFITLFAITLITKGQTVSVEKSIWQIQSGTFGVWLNNEIKLSNSIALRSEVGFDAGLWGGSYYDKTGFLLTPVLSVEPRWYYNLSKRASKSKRTSGNTGNYLSLKTSYHPDYFVISNYDNIRVINQISLIPVWGIRRNIGNHFNFETGIGLGYSHIFAKNAGYMSDENNVVLDLNLRIGYSF